MGLCTPAFGLDGRQVHKKAEIVQEGGAGTGSLRNGFRAGMGDPETDKKKFLNQSRGDHAQKKKSGGFSARGGGQKASFRWCRGAPSIRRGAL